MAKEDKAEQSAARALARTDKVQVRDLYEQAATAYRLLVAGAENPQEVLRQQGDLTLTLRDLDPNFIVDPEHAKHFQLEARWGDNPNERMTLNMKRVTLGGEEVIEFLLKEEERDNVEHWQPVIGKGGYVKFVSSGNGNSEVEAGAEEQIMAVRSFLEKTVGAYFSESVLTAPSDTYEIVEGLVTQIEGTRPAVESDIRREGTREIWDFSRDSATYIVSYDTESRGYTVFRRTEVDSEKGEMKVTPSRSNFGEYAYQVDVQTRYLDIHLNVGRKSDSTYTYYGDTEPGDVKSFLRHTDSLQLASTK